MTPNNPENPPAFPRTGFEADMRHGSDTDTLPQTGMTLRDYFAAKALQGLLSNPIFYDWLKVEGSKAGSGGMQGTAAQCANAFADALLAARQKGDK